MIGIKLNDNERKQFDEVNDCFDLVAATERVCWMYHRYGNEASVEPFCNAIKNSIVSEVLVFPAFSISAYLPVIDRRQNGFSGDVRCWNFWKYRLNVKQNADLLSAAVSLLLLQSSLTFSIFKSGSPSCVSGIACAIDQPIIPVRNRVFLEWRVSSSRPRNCESRKNWGWLKNATGDVARFSVKDGILWCRGFIKPINSILRYLYGRWGYSQDNIGKNIVLVLKNLENSYSYWKNIVLSWYYM